jgi:hypothetical protein
VIMRDFCFEKFLRTASGTSPTGWEHLNYMIVEWKFTFIKLDLFCRRLKTIECPRAATNLLWLSSSTRLRSRGGTKKLTICRARSDSNDIFCFAFFIIAHF